jgi:hypothetical protein
LEGVAKGGNAPQSIIVAQFVSSWLHACLYDLYFDQPQLGLVSRRN